MTSFVDLNLGRTGWLLGLRPGRSGAAVETWLAARDPAWRAGIEVVALDPSAPFAAAIRRLLPQATRPLAPGAAGQPGPSPRVATGVAPRSNSTGAAAKPTRHGRIGGCCSPPVTALPPRAGPAEAGPGQRRPDRRDRRRLGHQGTTSPAPRLPDVPRCPTATVPTTNAVSFSTSPPRKRRDAGQRGKPSPANEGPLCRARDRFRDRGSNAAYPAPRALSRRVPWRRSSGTASAVDRGANRSARMVASTRASSANRHL